MQAPSAACHIVNIGRRYRLIRASGSVRLQASAVAPSLKRGKTMDNDKRLNGKAVLIVEDEFLLAEDLRCTVEQAGGTIVGPIADASEALTAAREGRFDVALLDVGLKDQSSVAVARALAYRLIPFILITGYVRDALPPEMENALYLAKPVVADALLSVISALLT
jgi:CheY-like chemotaxis protein